SPDQLSAVDIEGTSRRPPADETAGAREIQPDAHATRAPIPQARGFGGSGLPSGLASDPLAAYRVNNSNGAPTYSYGAPVISTTAVEPPRIYGVTTAVPAGNRIDTGTSAKSSMIFVRSPGPTEV